MRHFSRQRSHWLTDFEPRLCLRRPLGGCAASDYRRNVVREQDPRQRPRWVQRPARGQFVD
jgi:hypothetical protein